LLTPVSILQSTAAFWNIVVNMSACVLLSVSEHISETTRPIFTKCLFVRAMAVARSFSEAGAIRYAPSVSLMTSYLH